MLVCAADNTVLELLDLSWNHLRQDGAVAIAKGLMVSLTLCYPSTIHLKILEIYGQKISHLYYVMGNPVSEMKRLLQMMCRKGNVGNLYRIASVEPKFIDIVEIIEHH